MASEKETMDGSELKEKEKDPTGVEGKGEEVEEAAGKVEVEKGGEDKGSEKTEEDEETEEAEKEGNEEEGKEEKGEEEEDDAEEEKKEKRSGKKGSRGKKTSEAEELSSPRTPGSERPTRERKTVERFMVTDTPRISTAKPVAIEKGQGTQLKDIPNVAFKLSKRKADENLQLLHTILFGKKAKAHSMKKNIGLFSGFVWAENEEKQKAKVKDKLDKCVKEKLVDFCDILNISVNKATTRKEEISAKLFEFLESPHATTDILLADKENIKKRKSKGLGSKSPGSRKSTKKQKSDSESGKKRKQSVPEDDDGKSDASENEDNQEVVPGVESDAEENKSEEEMNEDQDEGKKQKVVEKGSSKQTAKIDSDSSGVKSKSADAKVSDKSGRKSKSSRSKKETAEDESETKTKARVTKKPKAEKDTSPPAKTASPSKKKGGKSLKKVPENDQGESSEKTVKEPSREELHAVVVNMLKEVDFNTATLSDILRQLGKHFGVDLIHRKAEVKDIITEVIQNMSDDDEEDAEAESGDEDEAGKDEGDNDE